MVLRLDRLDPRIKWLILIAGGMMASWVPIPTLAALTAAVLWMLRPLPGRSFRFPQKTLLPFGLLLIGIFLIRSLDLQISWKHIRVVMTTEGAREGFRVCLRLAVVGLLGTWIALSTPMTQFKAAVEWMLRPIPFVNQRSVATLLGLMVRFIPEIWILAENTRQAQAARFMGHPPSVLIQIRSFVAILIRKTLLTADKLSDAMAARCFNELRTGVDLRLNQTDYVILVLVLSAFSLAFVLG